MSLGIKQKVKTSVTYTNGKPSGRLVELWKQGDLTLAYLTIFDKGAFKGMYYHKKYSYRSVVVKGRLKITLYEGDIKEEMTLEENERIYIPAKIWVGFENIADGETWMFNYPDPPADPNDTDEKLRKTIEEVEAELR